MAFLIVYGLVHIQEQTSEQSKTPGLQPKYNTNDCLLFGDVEVH